MTPSLLFKLGIAIVSGALCFIAAWKIQSATITEMELAHAETRIAAGRVARLAIERATTAVITAQSNAASRAPVLRAAADNTRTVGNGLRFTTADTVRSAATSADACNAIAAAYGVVVAESSELIQEVAGSADQCHSDITLMREAWPK